MKAIKLTPEHKIQLLEMCKALLGCQEKYTMVLNGGYTILYQKYLKRAFNF